MFADNRQNTTSFYRLQLRLIVKRGICIPISINVGNIVITNYYYVYELF